MKLNWSVQLCEQASPQCQLLWHSGFSWCVWKCITQANTACEVKLEVFYFWTKWYPAWWKTKKQPQPVQAVSFLLFHILERAAELFQGTLCSAVTSGTGTGKKAINGKCSTSIYNNVGQSRAVACTINVYKWKRLTRDERVCLCVCVTNITVSAASASPHQEAFSETRAFFVCCFCEFTGTRDLVLSPRNPGVFSRGVNWYGQSIRFPATGESGVPSSLYFTEADDRKPPRQRCSNRNKSSRVRSTTWFSCDLTTVTLTNRFIIFPQSFSLPSGWELLTPLFPWGCFSL